MEIRTNNIPRLLKYGYEMPEKFKADFDYITKEDFDYHSFFVYKRQWYDLSEFMVVQNNEYLKEWDGYSSDSFFSGVVVKIIDDDSIIVGQYFS